MEKTSNTIWPRQASLLLAQVGQDDMSDVPQKGMFSWCKSEGQPLQE
jgi:hypothetical protein